MLMVSMVASKWRTWENTGYGYDLYRFTMCVHARVARM